ncbi:hypothetical protein SAMN05192574_102310 [Mucilaginibacter gossypiicola]|uniref:Uncharacterized protein n=1 Tax=Mucilaginibacter gossypiicola TaxID=551995 RepID=A0A1H8DDM2_9SPHI|nr:hypothetical protein SAMN05192574_102310 [Mucilaginibacter gossypiicola]
MKQLSVKNLKKRTHTIFTYGSNIRSAGSETETGNDPTNTTVTVITTTHIFRGLEKDRGQRIG